MKVYVLLKLRVVDGFNTETVEVLEAIFETREAAEKVVKESFKITKTIIREYEVKK